MCFSSSYIVPLLVYLKLDIVPKNLEGVKTLKNSTIHARPQIHQPMHFDKWLS